MNFLDWLTILAYIAVNIDMVLQTKRIYKTKSSEDLSLVGMTVRYLAIIIVLFKFVSLDSMSLITGQVVTTLTFTVYFTLAVMYFLRHRRAKGYRTQA
jgi:uncharacterized protein with PQ loop repeat